ncbi:MAG TPA: hypothetical protein ENI65_12035 [Gammaproteobacteria bacterium]|nr:hypothetical protein [Gammaproteobacteria bacterium]
MMVNNNKLVVLAWIVIVLVSIFYIVGKVRIQSDLSAFFPAGGQMDRSLEQAIQQSQKGLASRIIMLSLSGATPQKLAELNKALFNYLEKHPDVVFVNNGEKGISKQNRELLFKYRFLLSPAADEQTFSRPQLTFAFTERLRELDSMAPVLDKQYIPRDPVILMRAYLQGLSAANQPHRMNGVWFTEDERQSVLLMYLHEHMQSNDKLGGFVQSLNAWLNQAQPGNVRLTVSGPGLFAYESRRVIEQETRLFSIVASIVIMLILYIAYRSALIVFFAAIPLLTGLLVATSVTHYLFEGLHGITLAFGVILLGIGIDYPIHFFSHLRHSQEAWKSIRRIWPTILAGVISSSLGFSVMVFSRFEGLQQLGVFAVTGLIVTAVVTRWVLPGLIMARPRPAGNQQTVLLPYQILARARLPLYMIVVFIPVIVFITQGQTSLIDRNIRQLSPVPDQVYARDRKLRQQLRVPDANRFLMIEADTSEALLRKTEKLSRDLNKVRRQGMLGAYQSVIQILPSKATQLARQSRLPTGGILSRNMTEALSGMPFKSTAFNGFITDAEASKELHPLTYKSLVSQLDTGLLSLRLDLMMQKNYDGWVSYIQLHDVKQPALFRQWLGNQQYSQVSLIDIAGTVNRLMSYYQRDVIEKSLYGLLLIVMVLVWTLKSGLRLVKVLLPVVLAILFTISVLGLFGVGLTLFHLVSLLLVLGIGIDYGLFMTRDESDQDRNDTLHSLLVCVVSTITVFSIIAFSDILVLQAIGSTVAIGVLSSFVLSALVVLPQNRNHNKSI